MNPHSSIYDQDMHEQDLQGLWGQLGGDDVMKPLIERFYQLIDLSSIKHLFPPDLTETQAKQFAFQSEFWVVLHDTRPGVATLACALVTYHLLFDKRMLRFG